MDLDLRLVRAFVTVVEEDNVGRGARRLYVSQPALSKQLQRLESLLDVQLFYREHRVLRLTPAGLSFYEQGKLLLETADEVVERTHAAARESNERAVLAFVAGTVSLASTILQMSRVQQPGFDLQLLRVDWLDQTLCLREDRADLSLVRLPIDDDGLELKVLCSEPRVGGFAINHPLAARTTLSIRELDDEPIIRTGNQQDYWTVNPRPSGGAPVLGPLANTVEEMLAVVAAGTCMCITAMSLAEGYPRPDIAWIPIDDISPSSVGIAWRSQEFPSAAVNYVSDIAHRASGLLEADTPA
jgi:DNA-binding transcriptional LysR family regulator